MKMMEQQQKLTAAVMSLVNQVSVKNFILVIFVTEVWQGPEAAEVEP